MDWLSKFIELGPLGVVCIALIFVVWKITDKYVKVIEANTEAMTRVADSTEELKESNKALASVLDKQGVMLTQQNFLFQQMCMSLGKEIKT